MSLQRYLDGPYFEMRDLVRENMSRPEFERDYEIAAVTAFTAGVMTIAFGAIARYPFAFATGLGINSLVAVTIAQQVTWAEAMGLVVIEGVIIVILAITGFRTAVFNAVPPALKAASTPSRSFGWVKMNGFMRAPPRS